LGLSSELFTAAKQNSFWKPPAQAFAGDFFLAAMA
jgi:hypothetical protein